MNKQTMTAIRKPAQAGFTLIELIVVIVILGILAATALPKFANLGGDARKASLNAALGAVNATTSMVHGQSLLNPGNGTVTNEGIIITLVNGYPDASANSVAAMGITANDYAITFNNTGSLVAAAGFLPAIPANGFVIIPKGIAGTTPAITCFVSYAQSTAANTAPVVAMTTTGC